MLNTTSVALSCMFMASEDAAELLEVWDRQNDISVTQGLKLMQMCYFKLQLPSKAEELHGVPCNDRAYSCLLS